MTALEIIASSTGSLKQPTVIYLSPDGRTRIVRNPKSVPMSTAHERDYQFYVIEVQDSSDALGNAQWRALPTETPARRIVDIIFDLLGVDGPHGAAS